MRVSNPLSEELPLLRTTLLPGLLRALARNVSRGQSDVAIFEIGSVFLPSGDGPARAPALGVDRAPTAEELRELDAALPDQPLHLAAVLCGDRVPASWWGPAQPSSWADAVEAARVVSRSLGVELRLRAGQRAPWHPGRCGVRAPAGRGEPGRVGAGEQSAPAGLRRLRAAAAERRPMELRPARLCSARAAGIVRAPAAVDRTRSERRTCALTVPDSVPSADVEAALRAGAGALLESLRLFDLYVGEQAGAGNKSLAYRLRFRAGDRTLTESEIKGARDAAVAEAARRVGAVQRSATS